MTGRKIGLLQACDDRNLLGAGIKLFPVQRMILDALDAGSHRTLIAALGRRSGKTHLAAVAMVHNALMRPDLDALVRPNELRYVAAIATNKEQAKVGLRVCEDLIRSSPVLRDCLIDSRDDELVLRTMTGGSAVITAFPCTSRGIRGRPISLLVLDEAAHFLDSDGNASDRAVMEAARPSMAQFGKAARLLMISTPSGTANMFAQEFQRAVSGEEPTSIAWQIPTREANPDIDPEFLEAEERLDPDFFRSEYLAEFVGGVGAFFDFSLFQIGDYVEMPPDASHNWIMGVDVALQKDPFAAVVVGRHWEDRGRLWVGKVDAWKPRAPKTFEDQAASADELFGNAIALAERFDVRQVLADQYMSKAVSNRFAKAGISTHIVPMSRDSKYQAFASLRSALYSGELQLPNVPELITELKQVRIKHGGDGSKIETPRTAIGHCDRACALALAVHRLTRVGIGGKLRTSLEPPLLRGPEGLVERAGGPVDDLEIDAEFQGPRVRRRAARSRFARVDV